MHNLHIEWLFGRPRGAKDPSDGFHLNRIPDRGSRPVSLEKACGRKVQPSFSLVHRDISEGFNDNTTYPHEEMDQSKSDLHIHVV